MHTTLARGVERKILRYKHTIGCGSVDVVIGRECTSRDVRGRTDGCNLSWVQIINRVGEARSGAERRAWRARLFTGCLVSHVHVVL